MNHEGWKISSWSTGLGRGVIESAAGMLPFDGSSAEVQANRPGVCAGLAIRRGEVEPGSFLFAFEPESSDEAPGHVMAASLHTK